MGSQSTRGVHRTTVVVLLVAAVALGLFIARQFLEMLLLAAITAGLSYRILERLEAYSGSRVVAGVVTSLLAIFLLVVPVSGLVTAAVFGLVNLVESELSAGGTAEEFIRQIRALPIVRDFNFQRLLESGRIMEALRGEGQDALSTVVRTLGQLGQGVLLAIVFVLALYYFLVDGERIRRSLEDALPLESEQKRRLLAHFVSVTRATLKGTVVMGVIQGALGGVLFLILGLPSPLVFGVIFAVLATIPTFGAVLIWLPTAIVLASLGDWGRALVMAGGGGVVIAATDYLIRPRLIGSGTALHPLLVLLGIFGGISVFGLSGLIIGPIIMAVFVQAWSVFSQTFGQEIAESADATPR